MHPHRGHRQLMLWSICGSDLALTLLALLLLFFLLSLTPISLLQRPHASLAHLSIPRKEPVNVLCLDHCAQFNPLTLLWRHPPLTLLRFRVAVGSAD